MQAGERKDVKFLFIGTHKDRMKECNKSLKDKNDTLRDIVRSFNMESNVIYNGHQCQDSWGRRLGGKSGASLSIVPMFPHPNSSQVVRHGVGLSAFCPGDQASCAAGVQVFGACGELRLP